MKYPKLKPSEDLRRRLTVEEIRELRSMRASGHSLQELADYFHVSKSAAYYHCSSKEKKKEINRQRYELIKDQLARDPSFSDKRKREIIACKAALLKRSPKHREYQNYQIKKSIERRASE